MTVRLRATRLSQPQGPVGIDRNNPDAQGLLLAVSGYNVLFDAAKNAKLSPSGLSRVVGKNGVAASTGTVSGSGIVSLPDDDRYRLYNTPCTIFHLGSVHPTDTGIHAIWTIRNTSMQIAQLTVDMSTSGLNFLRNGVNGSALTITNARDQQYFAMAMDSTSTELYSGDQSSTQSGGLFTTTSTIIPALYNRQGGGRGWAGNAYLTLLFERKLGANEIAKLASNPWQLFAPTERRIWVPVTAGGPTSYTLDAASGSFTISGQSAGLLADRLFDAQPATFSISGQDATLNYAAGTAYTLDAQPASFTLSGQSATLLRDTVVDAQPGSFALTGTDAGLVYAGQTIMDAQPGTFLIGGQDAALSAAKLVNAQPGTFTITGMDATLSYGALQPTLDAQPATFTITGADASLLTDRILDAQPGSFTLTGMDATIGSVLPLTDAEMRNMYEMVQSIYAAVVTNAPLDVNLVRVRGQTIGGTGSASDPWGPT